MAWGRRSISTSIRWASILADYDEFRFELRPEGSLVFVQAILAGFPAAGSVSSWYSKFKSRVDEWAEGRFDLRVDDDGISLSGDLLKAAAGSFHVDAFTATPGIAR